MWFFALIVVVLIGAVAVVASGRWGAMSTAYDDRPDMSVPARQALTSDDIETARFGVALRGYRMDEVDTLLERVAREVAERDRRIADLERAVTPIMHGPEGAGFTSRHTYDADDFDDTGYQLPILVGGDFPAETTTAPSPDQALEADQAPAVEQAPEVAQTADVGQTAEVGQAPKLEQAAEVEQAPEAEPTAEVAQAPEVEQAAEAQAPEVEQAAVVAQAPESQQTAEPEVAPAPERELAPTANQPVADAPRQTPEAPRPAERDADLPVAEAQATPQPAEPEQPGEPEIAQPAEPIAQTDLDSDSQAERGSVLEAPLPPVPPEPVLERPEEAQEQAAWWPAAESAGERPAAGGQEAPRSGQLWADPAAAAVANGHQEPQATSTDQQPEQNGQASEQAPRGRHSAAPDAGAYQRPS
ncbi:DivIVA domain-containing protein [Kribbella monticola]|uniref:DivIVA domain-containing protein n=1 Tax=Kribbella monticola TaxID=2185285 RepID=UPI000DD4A259|nr:DivIVA domain-containing protein [Kribbella monticola]